MLPRTLFEPEHDTFRDSLRRFLEREVAPHAAAWEAQGYVDRAIWQRAGELGFLCTQLPAEYGAAAADRRFSAIVLEEVARSSQYTGLGFSVHSDIVAVYLHKHATAAIKQRWLPAMVRGEAIAAIAMTEPSTGSDLQAIKTQARRDGSDYLISGQKVFITNGWHCDIAVVACKLIDPERAADGKNITLFAVEADRPGFRKGQPLKKLGMRAQDTGELFFDEVRVPAENIVGSPGAGFAILMQELAWERLMIALACVAGAKSAFAETLRYCKSRHAFGKPLSAFQHWRFKLAELKSEISLGEVYVDRCLALELEHKLPIDAAAAAKYWTSEMLGRVVDAGVQLHGGYGYITEYPIAQAYVDARVQRIYGGTSEIMKEIIGRML
jgi:alkylation response protein AidB-like acyl-CoA dehydrogenase